ncbi:MAG: extracellular solute-binding protein [Treponema sp.]|nr:extracellular solute-binding protein [Treponema sp.]
MRKKLLFAVIAILAVSSVLWAGGGKQAAPAAASGGLSGTVTFWQGLADMSATTPDVQWWKDNYRLFQEKYPNVKLEVTNTPGGGTNYQTKIYTELAAGNAPDIFKTWLTGRLEPFVTAGRVQALNGFLDARPELKKSINPEALKLATWDGKFYAIPNQKSGELLFYNKKMFADQNVQVPKTYDEFMALCAKFNAAGIVPIAMGGAQIWPPAMPYMILFGRMNGPALYEEVVMGHKAKFDDPALAQTGAKLQEMIKANVFNSNVNAMNMEECRAGFGNGKYPMLFDGVWSLGRYVQALGDDLGFFPFPTIPGGKGSIDDQLVNWDDGYAISVGAKNQAGAEAFLEFIFSKERQTEQANFGNLITTFNPPTNTNLPKIVTEVSTAIDNATYGYIPWDNPMGSGLGNEFNLAVQRLYNHEDPVKIFQDLNKQAKVEWE